MLVEEASMAGKDYSVKTLKVRTIFADPVLLMMIVTCRYIGGSNNARIVTRDASKSARRL